VPTRQSKLADGSRSGCNGFLQARWHLTGTTASFTRKALAVGALLALSVLRCFPAHAATVPLKRLGETALPGFSGDFDHFAVDETGNRLFLAGEDHKTLEVFDLKTGRRLKSIDGFGAPHAIFYLADSDRIVVTDGDLGILRVLRGKDYSEESRVLGLAGADSARLEEDTRTLYIVTGGKDVPLDHSYVVAVDLHTNKKLREIRIDSNHVEGLALEKSGSRMFVNLTDKHAVAVIDRQKMKETDRWPIGSDADNSPMAFDETHKRLLIVCRKPGTLVVMNSQDGKIVARMPAAERSDDIAFDAARGRIYVPGGDGWIFVFRQNGADEYELLAKVESAPGAKTCLLVPGISRFFVAVSPGDTKAEAKILTYEVEP